MRRSREMLSFLETCSVSRSNDQAVVFGEVYDDPLGLSLGPVPADILIKEPNRGDVEPMVLLTRVPVRTRALYRWHPTNIDDS